MLEKIRTIVEELKEPAMLRKPKPTRKEVEEHFAQLEKHLKDNGFSLQGRVFEKESTMHVFNRESKLFRPSITSGKEIENSILNYVEVAKSPKRTTVSLVLNQQATPNVQAMRKALQHSKYELEEQPSSVGHYAIVSPQKQEVARLSSINRIVFDFQKHASELNLEREEHFRNIVLTLLSENALTE